MDEPEIVLEENVGEVIIESPIIEISEEMYTITDNVITIDGSKLLNIKDDIELGDDSTKAQLIILSDGRVTCFNNNEQTEGASLPAKQTQKNKKSKRSKVYQCSEPNCNRFYNSMNHLKVHLRNHTGDKPYKCTIEDCEKAFSTEYSRKAHVRTHTGEKPYSCPDAGCSKAFKTSGDLQKHVRTHTGERPFLCSIDGCSKAFTTSNIRKIHMRTHTGERPYVCEVEDCKRKFASSTNFKNHMRIHSGEKPYECNRCGKRFTEYSSLYKHNMVHSTVKNYLCTYCPKKYRQLSTLTTHKKVIHGVFAGDDGNDIVFEELVSDIKEDNELNKIRLTGIEPQSKCCNKTFSNKANLITHLKSQHNITIAESEEGIIVQIEKDDSLDTQSMKNISVIKMQDSSPLFFITQDNNANDEMENISEEEIIPKE